MKTLGEILQLSSEFLKARNVPSARREAEEILSLVLDQPRLELYMDFQRPLDEKELALCRSYLQRRAKREPTAYIRGQVEFLDCKVQVDSRVLVPRQETEILAAQVVKHLKNDNLEGKVLWDLCCGSGCLAMAMKKQLPQLEVHAVDISSDALQLAMDNARSNALEIFFHQADIREGLGLGMADYILCNPPYISLEEYEELEAEVREHEPQLALVAENHGLEFYQTLKENLPQQVRDGGEVWMEFGHLQGKSVKNIFIDGWPALQIGQDWSQKDRFLYLPFPQASPRAKGFSF